MSMHYQCPDYSHENDIVMAAPAQNGRETRTYECVYGHREECVYGHRETMTVAIP